MTFNSLPYLVLLLVTAGLFFGLPRFGRLVLLVTASVVFYAFWSLPFVGLILLSAGVDFAMGLAMGRYEENDRARKGFLVLSILTNLSILGYFKYSNFFLDSVTSALGQSGEFHYLHVLLPPGISFYTFQSMSYTIDVYRRQIAPTRSFLRFFLYVSFFPQLVAGPIERAGHLLTQFDQALKNRFNPENLITGSQLIIWGLFKKVCIADPVGFYVDQYYNQPHLGTGTMALLATYGFGIQIYCDFSAYSTIARGSARIFGISLIRNFDQPLLAPSMMGFWRRWHISLATWIRDYLYRPLGGNRVGPARALVNLFIVAALSGLWHGAAWNFVAWGLYHGALMVVIVLIMRTRAFARFHQDLGSLAPFCGWLLQFHLSNIGFVLFRGTSREDIFHTFHLIGDGLRAGLPMSGPEFVMLLLVYGFLLLSWVERRFYLMARIQQSSVASLLFYGGLIVAMLLWGNTGEVPFIYFQF